MIKAKETRYKGYHFRSRLEARWAVFFDALGLEYQYEPQGFDLSDKGLGSYLPDFYLPDSRCWIEVKPTEPSGDETFLKLMAVAECTGEKAYLVAGEPMKSIEGPPISDRGNAWWMAFGHVDALGDRGAGADGPNFFCVCPECDRVGIEFDGRGDRVCSPRCEKPKRTREEAEILGHWSGLGHGDKAYSYDHPNLIFAANQARAARFEHGQSGAK